MVRQAGQPADPGCAAARRLGQQILTEEAHQRGRADARASELEETSPGQQLFEMRIHTGSAHAAHSFVTVPSKLRIRFATIVYEASSATSRVSSRADLPWLTSSSAAARST